MTKPVTSNSSIFQPVVDFTGWCEVETFNLFKPLPAKDKWNEIAKRIVILCSVIIPVIGALTALISNLDFRITPNPQRPAQTPAQRPQTPASRPPVAPGAKAPAQQQQAPNLPPPATREEEETQQALAMVASLEETQEVYRHPMTPQEIRDSEAILESLNNLAEDTDQVTTYIALREKFEKIDPNQLNNLRGVYDLVVLKINQLDVAANLYFQANNGSPLSPFAPNFASAQGPTTPNNAAQPTMAEKIGTADMIIESVQTAINSGEEFALDTYQEEKNKFHQIIETDVPENLKLTYQKVATMIQEIDQIAKPTDPAPPMGPPLVLQPLQQPLEPL